MEYCPGFTDINGIWNNGFPCPRWGGIDRSYCCGHDRDRYCCPEPEEPSGGDNTGSGGTGSGSRRPEVSEEVVGPDNSASETTTAAIDGGGPAETSALQEQ